MLKHRWLQVKQILLTVSDAPAELQRETLIRLCGGDSDLQAEVEELLKVLHDETVVVVLENQASAFGPRDDGLMGHSEFEQTAIGGGEVSGRGLGRAVGAAGGLVGRYVRGEVIGRGRTGVVYAARDMLAQRDVAIKLLRPEIISGDLERRLLAEGRALARLNHPGIARVLDVGTDDVDGSCRTFLVMEIVKGQDIISYARDRGLGIAAKLGLFVQLCDAVEHAHRCAVLHRDLKPANVLVAECDGQELVKVLDFGLAKFLDEQPDAAATLPGQVVGTLAYMSPEQAGGDVRAAETRTDVYGLGAVLYHLLAGHPPIATNGLSLLGAIRAITAATPPPLGSVDRALRGDLELIAGKALEKNPERRYGSAGALGDDVRNFLEHRPVAARGPGTWYVLNRLVRRHPGPVAGAGAALLALLAAVVVSVQAARASSASLAEARTERERARAALATLLDNVVATLVPRIGTSADVRRVLESMAGSMDGLVKSAGDDPAVLGDYAVLLGRLVDAAQADRQIERAGVYADRALAVRARLARMAPDDPGRQADLSIATVRRGNIAAEYGDHAAASRRYAEALKIDEMLAERHPNVERYLNNLTFSYERMAFACLEERRVDDARRLSERQLEFIGKLEAVVGGGQATSWAKACALSTGAAMFDTINDRVGAMRLRMEQLPIVRSLVAASPDERRFRVMAAGTCARLAGGSEGALEDVECQRLADEALEHLEALLAAGERETATLEAELGTLEFLISWGGFADTQRLIELSAGSVERTRVLDRSVLNTLDMMAHARQLRSKALRLAGRIGEAEEELIAAIALARECIASDNWSGEKLPRYILTFDHTFATPPSESDRSKLMVRTYRWTVTRPGTLARLKALVPILRLMGDPQLAVEVVERAIVRLPEAEHEACRALLVSDLSTDPEGK